MEYDNNNVFARILRGELPSDKVFENDDLLCFKDSHPIARVHVLIIPKGDYVNYSDFVTNASHDVVARFFKTIPEIAAKLGVKEYKLITNCCKLAS